MHIDELIPWDLLVEEVDKGYVRATRHPSLPLVIYNYTEQAQFQRRWNEATRQCRGLIVNVQTGQVVARPFDKFFNDQEHPHEQARLQQGPVEVTDKMDGSLGILYPVESPEGLVTFAIATRGSFTSAQALHATRVWRERYEHFTDGGPGWKLNPGWTLLFEIIYPENRIVVDYGGLDDLMLLGAVHIATGHSVGPEMVHGWPGPHAEVFPYRDYTEALRAPHRPGKEGLVLFWPKTGFRIKMKQSDYVELHRIVTGLNERSIWQRLAEGRDVFDGIPDELHNWVASVANPMQLEFDKLRFQARYQFDRVNYYLSPWDDRREFALKVRTFEPWLKTCMFLLLDGKSIDKFLWKLLRPVGPTKRARGGGEDVA